jgi:hypothetical protein
MMSSEEMRKPEMAGRKRRPGQDARKGNAAMLPRKQPGQGAGIPDPCPALAARAREKIVSRA